MGKVIKVREVGDHILEKQCDEVDIKNINYRHYRRFKINTRIWNRIRNCCISNRCK